MYILYFDVNKTMIMLDPIQGKGVDHVCNDILAETCYGRMENLVWQWNQLAPCQVNSKEDISYSNFIRSAYPNTGSTAEMKTNKELRKGKRGSFLSNEGIELRKYKSQLMAKLTKTTWIIPAFFHFIIYLEKENVDYTLILRTFGCDLDHVVDDFNAFCDGKHPMFPSVCYNGKNGTIDRRIQSFGTFYRTEKHTTLILNTIQQYEHHSSVEYEDMDKVDGWNNIHHYFNEKLTTKTCMAIRDDYHHWWTNRQSSSAGKPMTIDTSSTVHPIFFDDNILQHDAHIVDLRNVDGTVVDYSISKDKYLIPVQPLMAILQDDYYIEKFKNSLLQ